MAKTVIDPEFDRRYLRVALNTLPRGRNPARKRALLQESAPLVDLGVTLMTRADEARGIIDVRRNASQFRDAFQVALLALRPFRIKNFAEMALGSNLIQRGRMWWFIYSPQETKNGRFLEVQFPDALAAMPCEVFASLPATSCRQPLPWRSRLGLDAL